LCVGRPIVTFGVLVTLGLTLSARHPGSGIMRP
jgi:hypothetical protein